MSRRVEATSATVMDDHAFQMYIDRMQQLLLDSTVELQYVSRGIGKRLQRTPPDRAAATDSQVRGAAASIRRDTKRAALALSVAASLLARADAVHTDMFMKKRTRRNNNNRNGQNNNNRQGNNRGNNRSAA